MEISEGLIEQLEMVFLEEVEALRALSRNGEQPSPLDIAIGYLSPEYGASKQLSHQDHATALACLVGIALHWLSCREGAPHDDYA